MSPSLIGWGSVIFSLEHKFHKGRICLHIDTALEPRIIPVQYLSMVSDCYMPLYYIA